MAARPHLDGRRRRGSTEQLSVLKRRSRRSFVPRVCISSYGPYPVAHSWEASPNWHNWAEASAQKAVALDAVGLGAPGLAFFWNKKATLLIAREEALRAIGVTD